MVGAAHRFRGLWTSVKDRARVEGMDKGLRRRKSPLRKDPPWSGCLYERGHTSLRYHPGLLIARDEEEMSQRACQWILGLLHRKRDALVCLATGTTPTRTYELLAEQGRQRRGGLRKVRWLQLDEWVGLGPDDPGSCQRYLQEKLLGPLQVPPEQYCGWDGRAANQAEECRRVALWLEANGPIDLCILGVGADGHVAMIGPGPTVRPGPHVAELSPRMQQHPMLAAVGAKVELGLTLGMGDILESARIMLLASGPSKADALGRLWFQRVVTTELPVSFLWLHPRVTIFCDRAAAAHIL